MRSVIEVIWAALEDCWDHLFITAACSLLWLVLVLLVIPGPPATVALVDVARRIHARKSVSPGEYLRSVWTHFGAGWRWGTIALSVLVVLGVDYGIAPNLLAPGLVFAARLFIGVVMGIWLIVQFYAVPLIFEQENKAVLLAQRNAAVMVLRHPGYSLGLAATTTVLLWLSLLLIVVNFLAGPMFLAFLGVRAVRERLALWRAANP